jgi:gliding motility-associated protein GldM
MIQMMYLVYTAMLALNVSANILDAFVVVDDTLVTSTTISTNQNNKDYAWFDQQKTLLGAKVDEADKKAKQLRKETDAMVKYIEKMRNELIFAVDGDSLVEKEVNGQKVKVAKAVGDIKKKDNFDIPTDYMINKGNAKKLKAEIKKYKANILKLAKKEDQKHLEEAMGLNVDAKYLSNDKKEQDWETHNFDHIIAAASVTLLNKMVGEVKNAESTMLTYLKASISADDFKFDNVTGRSIPKSQMVFSGDSYEADIIVAAYDSKSTPEVWYKMGADTLTEEGIGGATKLEGENGLVKLKIGTSGTGEQKYAGVIKILDPSGQPKYYGFKDKYTVLTPSATIAADKMNVLYAGIANPVSVSGPVSPDKLSVSFPGCNATSTGGGKFNVSVPASMIGKTVTATVAAKVGESTKTMGSTVFRVKKVPDPKAVLGAGIRGGKRAKAELLANPVIRATMGDDFVYDLKWSVNSFRVQLVVKGMDEPAIACQGGALSDKAKSAIQKAPAGTVVYFMDIKVSSEAGSRTLDEFSVRIR